MLCIYRTGRTRVVAEIFDRSRIQRGEIQKGAQGTILTNFSKKRFAAFPQWHPKAAHI